MAAPCPLESIMMEPATHRNEADCEPLRMKLEIFRHRVVLFFISEWVKFCGLNDEFYLFSNYIPWLSVFFPMILKQASKHISIYYMSSSAWFIWIVHDNLNAEGWGKLYIYGNVMVIFLWWLVDTKAPVRDTSAMPWAGHCHLAGPEAGRRPTRLDFPSLVCPTLG